MPKPKNPFAPEGVRPPNTFVPALGSNPTVHEHHHTVTPLTGDIVYRFAGDRVLAGSGVFMLDIDGSGKSEVGFEYRWLTVGDQTELALVVETHQAGRILMTGDKAPALRAEGDTITSNSASPLSWASGVTTMASRATVDGNPGPWSGPWVGANKGYLGLEIATDEGTRLGWIRLSVEASNGHLTVHGYAYRLTPGAEIVAGQES